MDNYLYLPTEIIIDIFEYLHHNELKTASMTCKYWYNAKFLTKTFKLHNVFIICKENLKYIPSMNANLFHNIKIRNLSKSEQIQLCEYLNDFEGIVGTCHITLKDLEVCDASTLLILKKLCTNGTLKSIELDCCTNRLFTNHFNELNYILRNVETFSINLPKISLDLSKSVKPLRLSDTKKEIFKLMSNLKNLVHLKVLGDKRETTLKINKLLNNLSKKLETIEIHYIEKLEPPAFYFRNIVIDEMSHKSNFADYNKIIMGDPRRLNNLTQLILSRSFISDNFFQIISKNMKKLQILKLNECFGSLTGCKILCLKNLKCLKVLNLNNFMGSRNQFSYGLEFGIFEKCNENLEELKLNSLHLTESCVVKISSLPNLRILELKDNPGVTNDTLQSIIFNCRWLRSLNLSLNRISDAGVSRLISISELKGLRELEMMECSITDEVLKEHFKFLELKKINLLGCTELTAESVQLMLKNCPSLEEVLFDY